MLYIFLIALFLIFWFSYVFTGRDFFNPITVQIMGFVFSAAMCVAFMWSLNVDYQFHWNTIILIVSALALSALIGVVTHFAFEQIKIPACSLDTERITPISTIGHLIVLPIVIFTILWVTRFVANVGGRGVFHYLNSFTTEEEGQFPFLLNQFIGVAQMILIVYGFSFIRFYSEMSLIKKLTHLLVVILCCFCTLSTSSRYTLAGMLLGIIALFHLLRIQRNNGHKTYKIKTIVRISMLLICFLWGFSFLRGFLGKGNQMSALNYLYMYSGTESIVLDQYLQNPWHSTIWGQYSFFGTISNLRKLGFNIPIYVTSLRMYPVGGGYVNNVYTCFGPYYIDFGVVGVYVMHGISTIIMSVFYEYVKKRRKNYPMLAFALIYQHAVLSFFSTRFLGKTLCYGFFRNLIILYLLYELLLKKRIRIRLRKNNAASVGCFQ